MFKSKWIQNIRRAKEPKGPKLRMLRSDQAFDVSPVIEERGEQEDIYGSFSEDVRKAMLEAERKKAMALATTPYSRRVT